MGCKQSKVQNKEQIYNQLVQEQNQRYIELDTFFKEDHKELKSFSQIPEEIIIDCFPDVKSKQEFMDNYHSELTPEEKLNVLSNISQKYQKVCTLSTNLTSNNFDDYEQQLSIQDEQLLNENELKPIQNEKVNKIFNYKTTSFNKTEVAVRYSFMDKIGNYNTETGKYQSKDHKQTAYISKGVIKDDTHRRIGNIGCTGIVRDEKGKQIGSISSLGVVRNAQGQTIAKWENKDLSLGAFTYFFSDNAQKNKQNNYHYKSHTNHYHQNRNNNNQKKTTSNNDNNKSSNKGSNKQSKHCSSKNDPSHPFNYKQQARDTRQRYLGKSKNNDWNF